MSEQSFRQIYGVETEWPISVKYGDSSNKFIQLAIHDVCGKFLDEYLPDGVVGTMSQFSSSSANFLSNGSRYYNDLGSRFEYATPEDVSIESVTVSEMAGEWILAEGLRRHIAADNNVYEGFMCRRVDGANHSTWGRHINVGEARSVFSDTPTIRDVARPLVTHIASSLPLFGGGAVYQNNAGNYRYSYGQKILNPITEDFSSDTIGEMAKPIINLRDEPHADADKYFRLHIVGVDQHVSPWANKMLIGSISLVLLACREGVADSLVFKGGTDSGARAMQKIARDMSFTQRYQLEDGDAKLSIFDIQEKLIESVKKTKERTVEQDRMLEEWENGVVQFKHNPDSFLKSDAILKKKLLHDDLDRRKKTSLDAGSRVLDILYTSPLWTTKEDANKFTTDELLARSFAGKVRAKYFCEDMPKLEDVKHRIVNPPETTRAYRRGNEIRDYTVRWNSWNEYSDKEDVYRRGKVSDPLNGAIQELYRRPGDIL